MFANIEEARVRGRHEFLQRNLTDLIERKVQFRVGGDDITKSELARLQAEVEQAAAAVAALPA
ncbi:MAG: hypothetical protein JWR59_621 [Brevundimonas sp.]|nr:hypothetical protein [Brevundimonas sp.]